MDYPKLLLIPILLALLFACRVPPPSWNTKHDSVHKQNTVRIYSACKDGWGMGSGVLLEGHVVLTAYHVVDCKGTIYVHHSGVMVRAHLGMATPSYDLALLALEVPLPSSGVTFGPPPKRGERVCSFPARDKRDPVCGNVITQYEKREKSDLAMWMGVQPGDSGGGVYDKKGRLVGVIISRIEFPGNAGIKGFATLLQGRLTREE